MRGGKEVQYLLLELEGAAAYLAERSREEGDAEDCYREAVAEARKELEAAAKGFAPVPIQWRNERYGAIGQWYECGHCGCELYTDMREPEKAAYCARCGKRVLWNAVR